MEFPQTMCEVDERLAHTLNSNIHTHTHVCHVFAHNTITHTHTINTHTHIINTHTTLIHMGVYTHTPTPTHNTNAHMFYVGERVYGDNDITFLSVKWDLLSTLLALRNQLRQLHTFSFPIELSSPLTMWQTRNRRGFLYTCSVGVF